MTNRIAKRVVVTAIVAAGLGCLVAWLVIELDPVGETELPYLHIVPSVEGGVALRFAMVHDVVHERFAKHGPAYYRERNRLVRQAVPGPDFDGLDDLAVGLEFAGEHDEAIRLMRDKLQFQFDLGLSEEELYSTHANLGTFLILGPFRQVRPGNAEDREVLREGLACIREAIRINPNSHFGRERWQAAIIEYRIALHADPELLLRFDMIGNRLDGELSLPDRSPMSDFNHKPGKAGYLRWGVKYGGVWLARRVLTSLQDRKPYPDYDHLRRGIAQVGAESGWFEATASQLLPVPFDEPTLGIVGMWRLGGGAHPYFAVALGETMLRVGQRYLAWSAFERAARLADLAWPDPDLQKRFAEHCRRRQSAIEALLPPAEVPKLRPAFEADLAHGLAYQKAYQDYEEKQIAAGKSIDDPKFTAEFEASREPIATPVGRADWFEVAGTGPSWYLTLGMAFAGVFAMLAALWPSRPKNETPGA